jgi:LytS/YehU family sensor histidine kinase
MAGEWSFQLFIGRFSGNPWPAVFVVSPFLALSSIAAAYLSVAAVAAVIRLARVGRAAYAQNQRALALELRLRESQERFLRWQMSPHFLFNALNSLAVLIRRDGPAAERFLRLLEEFYDEVASIDEQRHAVEDELRLLSSYFAIERVRFGDGISFVVETEPAARQARVPTLLLQPLVENAVKHGSRNGGTMPVHVAVRAGAASLRISVSNPASGAPRAEGAGLRITRERLTAMYGAEATLRTELAGGWFIASAQIPLSLER